MIILALLLVALAFYALLHQPKPRRRRHGNAAGGSYATLIGGYSGPSWNDGGSHGHHCGSHGDAHDGSCGH